MGLFDFIENFFFVGLALLFVLVLLLVYHFKQRMNSVEKKGDNMFDLLTNVVRELRNIRTNISGGGVVEPVMTPAIPQKYTVNKVEAEVESETDDEDYESAEESEDESDDGITYQIIDAKEKVIVSDESESESESESTDLEYGDTDSESDELESDIESEMDPNDTVNEIPLETDEVISFGGVEEVPLETDDVEPITKAIHAPVVESFSEEVPLEVEPEVQCEEVCEITTVNHTEDSPADDIQPITRNTGVNQEKLNTYKKMNVNQLKALAIQAGIQGDTSKLKKTAIIELLLEKQV